MPDLVIGQRRVFWFCGVRSKHHGNESQFKPALQGNVLATKIDTQCVYTTVPTSKLRQILLDDVTVVLGIVSKRRKSNLCE